MLLAAGVVMVGCRDNEAAPSFSTIAVTSTAYVTIPARVTTSTVAAVDDDAAADGGDGSGGQDEPVDDPTQERTYEIQAGDYLVGIASDFDVPVDNIVQYNGWSDGLRHPLVPGEAIRIPPSDYDPSTTSPAGPGDGTVPEGSTAGDSVGECPNGEPRETYTIQPGDIPARVARANDTTVDELDAANVGVVGYTGFVVGIEINLPC